MTSPPAPLPGLQILMVPSMLLVSRKDCVCATGWEGGKDGVRHKEGE